MSQRISVSTICPLLDSLSLASFHQLLTCLLIGLLLLVVTISSFASSPHKVLETQKNRVYVILSNEFLFCILVGITLIFGQLPIICSNFQLNHPDEAFFLVQALTLTKHPVFWQSVDGGTSGPLTSWFLALPLMLGLFADYSLARIVALCAVLISIASMYCGARILFSKFIARLGIIPVVVFFTITRHPDFVQFTSHHVAFMFLSLGFFFLCVARWKKWDARYIFLTSLCFGALPLAKIQYSALGFVGCGMLAVILLSNYRTQKITYKPIIAGLSGALFFSALFIGMASIEGSFIDFFKRYILSNLIYVNDGTISSWTIIRNLPFNFGMWGTDGFKEFFKPILYLSLLVLIAGLIQARRSQHVSNREILYCSLMMLFTSIYSAAAPARLFDHYALIVVIPFTVFFIAIIDLLFALRGKSTWFVFQPQFLSLVIIYFSSTIQIHNYTMNAHPLFNYPTFALKSSLPVSEVARTIIPYVNNFDRMSVWGYNPSIYVETQTIMGTRDAVAYYELRDTPYQQYYLDEYVEDLIKNKPKIFIDTIGPLTWGGFNENNRFGHQNFPAIHNYIEAHYELIPQQPEGAKVYVRREFP